MIMASADVPSVHAIISSVNGPEWLGRWKWIHGLVTPTVLRERVTLSFDDHATDLTGSGVYAKEATGDSETRYDIVNGWQVNYVRGHCSIDGHLTAVQPQCYNDEAFFGDFFSRRPASRVLDVGCNTGKNLARAVRYGGPNTEVWGIEYSEDSVRIAQATFGEKRIFQGDASADFVAEHGWERKFTAVQCTAVLQHLAPNQVEAVIGNMARCLCQGGELLLTFKDAPTEDQLKEKGMAAWSTEIFTSDLASKEQYLRDGYLRAVMWDDDYYSGVASKSPPTERDLKAPGLHRRELVFYSLEWIKARAAEHGLHAEDVEVFPDSKIPRSAFHWKVVFRAKAESGN